MRERRNFRVPSGIQIPISLIPLSPRPVPPIMANRSVVKPIFNVCLLIFLFVSYLHVMSAFVRSPRASHRLHAPSSGAIHKWMTTSCNLFLTSCSCLRRSRQMQRSSARNDPDPRRSTWCHRISRRRLAPFPSPTGVGEGFRILSLTRPLTHRMQVFKAVLHWGARSPIRVAHKRKRQSPALVED
jgi:hypothetical protein